MRRCVASPQQEADALLRPIVRFGRPPAAAQEGAMSLDRADPEVAAGLAWLEAYLEAQRRERGLVGLSAALVSDQELLWARGFGHADAAARRPATPQTVYSVASITKVFTATMLLQLRDAGRLHLDDPIARHDPALQIPAPFPDPPPITFRHLASHTAGLEKDFPLPYWDTLEAPPIADLLASLPRAERLWPPLTAFKYSNLGMALLGHALARVAGQPYPDYVAARILRPLGMGGSGFALSAAMRPHLAVGYRRLRGAGPPVPAPFFARHELGGLAPAGGLYASVADMARFMALQFRDGPAGGEQVLAGASLREMRAPVWLLPDWQRAIGLGWWLGRAAGETSIGHAGDHPGFDCEIRLLPALKLGLAVFVNTDTETAPLLEAALAVLVPIARRAEERGTAAVTTPPRPDWRRYVGHYAGRMSTLDVTLTAAGLAGRFAISPADETPDHVALDFVDEYVFRMRGGSLDGERIVFELDAAGRIARARLNGFLAERV